MSMEALRRKLSYANAMATIAVFIALGGSAYAVTQLPKNSVGSKQLKKNAVTAAKIKDGTITGQKIKLSTLGTVPSANSAATAGSAGTAGKASDSDALGGKPASAFAASTVVRSATVNGGLVTSKSDGIGLSNFLHTGEGVYCIKGLSPAPHTAVASVDITAEQGSTAATAVHSEAESECQVEIFTYDKAGGDANRPFSVIVH
ncbi:MAG TPA: hypothetical protein VFX44_01810 [Solirubrobacterales bacterium]|nr:hypothetical protein [Solirubrobacterales bacterium]